MIFEEIHLFPEYSYMVHVYLPFTIKTIVFPFIHQYKHYSQHYQSDGNQRSKVSTFKCEKKQNNSLEKAFCLSIPLLLSPYFSVMTKRL